MRYIGVILIMVFILLVITFPLLDAFGAGETNMVSEEDAIYGSDVVSCMQDISNV